MFASKCMGWYPLLEAVQR